MTVPLQITFRHMDSSEAVAARIRERAEKLRRFHDRIVSCRVVVEAPHRRQRQGRLFHVSVDVTLPGDEILCGRNSAQDQAHEDVYVAVRHAFDAVRHRVEDRARRRRGEVKSHAAARQGRAVDTGEG
jgi:ribosomal subunit interface protein